MTRRCARSPTPWPPDDTRQAVTLALWHLRRDVRAALRGGVVQAAEALGVHRDTLHAWQRDGWLAAGGASEGD